MSLCVENEAINRVLSHWNQFRGLVGGSLYVDGRIVAFSVGEDLDGKSLGVHFEKGLGGFKGVYQTINCAFSRHAGRGFATINRTQDLDKAGLRQAKMTYNPMGFLSDNIARSRLPFEEWTVRYKQDWQSGCYEAFGFGVAESEKGKCFGRNVFSRR